RTRRRRRHRRRRPSRRAHARDDVSFLHRCATLVRRAICDNPTMKRATAVGLGIGTVAAVLVAYYFVRHRDPDGQGEQPSDPWATGGRGGGPARPHRADVPPGGGMGGDLPVLIDDDPAGALRLEGQVLGEGDKGVGGATVVLSS